MKKLHLGCGSVQLEGWVNIDIDSPMANLVHDLTEPLPFADSSVSHVFCEHVIEHFEYADALRLLKECKRVLGSKGTLRISTPDLTWLTVVYHSGLTTEWGDLWHPDSPCVLLNEGMRAWGHKFLFDRAQLHVALHDAGFGTITDCDWRESLIGELQGLETRPFHHDLIVEACEQMTVSSPLPDRIKRSAPLASSAIEPLLAAQGAELALMRDQARASNEALHRTEAHLLERIATIERLEGELVAASTKGEQLVADRDLLLQRVHEKEEALNKRVLEISARQDELETHCAMEQALQLRAAENERELAARARIATEQQLMIEKLDVKLSDLNLEVEKLVRFVSALKSTLLGRIAIWFLREDLRAGTPAENTELRK